MVFRVGTSSYLLINSSKNAFVVFTRLQVFSEPDVLIILGITGAFGCGKSAVLRFFASRRWHTFDADAACKQLYADRVPEVMAAVREIFGDAMFGADGAVDLGRLGREAFREPAKMPRLTAALYPALTRRLRAEIAECRKRGRNGAFELPLLYEAGFEGEFDAVLAVWAPETLRRQRLYGRHFDDAEIDRRSRMQLDADSKLEKADYAVINSGTLADLDSQLDELMQNWQ